MIGGRKLAVLVLNYNGLSDSASCLNSVLPVDPDRFRIILIDNGSTDESLDALSQGFPTVEFIRNPVNMGYAGGMNLGIRAAMARGSEYVFLLNNDTIVERGLLDEITRFADSHPEVGVFGPRIVRYEHPEVNQFRWLDGVTEPTERYDLSGAALLIRTQILAKVGLLDPIFFMYWEDGDFLNRCKKRGVEAVYVPTRFRVLHKIGVSASKVGDLAAYYMIRNGFLCMRRYGSGPEVIRHMLRSALAVFSLGLPSEGRLARLKAIKDGCSLFLANPAPPAPLNPWT